MMLLKTLPALNDYEHEVCTLLEKGPLAEPLEKAGVKVVSLEIKKDGLLTGVRRFWGLTRSKPDLCISYLIHADLFVRFFGVLFGLKPRVVFIRNNLLGSQYDKLLRLERMTSLLVKAYFSVSGSVAKIYQDKLGYPAQKFTVIPNGIVLEPLQEAKPLDKKELGLTSENKIVLMVSKFYPQKGHTYLVEAWAAVSKVFPEARLLLAGDGPQRAEIEAQVQATKLTDSIHFLGVRKDVPRLLKTADLFVFPTLFEGMSNALLEAMAAGCAIVTTAIPENQEVATPDEVSFVPVKDPGALAAAIIELLQKPKDCQELGERAYQKVFNQFRIELTVQKLNEAYRKLL